MNRTRLVYGTRAYLVSLFFLVAGTGPAFAQSGQTGTTMDIDWTERHEPNMALAPHDFELLGDAIDLMSGRLTFEQVDVSIPGNSKLPVEIRRRLNPSQLQGGELADWQLAIPTISTKILQDEWYSGNRWGKNRCTNTLVSAIPSAQWPTYWGGLPIEPARYSDGVILDVPGRTTSQVLDKAVSAGWPASAEKVTADGWYLECISNIDGNGTQGFIAVAPNGDRYRFDVLLDSPLPKSEYDIWYKSPQYPPNRPTQWRKMQVYYDTLAVSEITDVNGNWVHFDYGGDGLLDRITSNDDREIAIFRDGYRLIDHIVANPNTSDPNTVPRQWNYAYGQSSVSMYAPPSQFNGTSSTHSEVVSSLTSVTLPDGRQWGFDLANLNARGVPGVYYNGKYCKQLTKTASVTHPDGVVGTFVLSEFELPLGAGATGSSGSWCPNTDQGAPGSSQVSDVMSVVSKTLSAASIATSTWLYDYVDLSSEIETTITRPDGSKRVVYHPTPFDWSTPRAHANITDEEIYAPGAGTPMETRTYTYLQESDAGSNFVFSAIRDTYRPVRSDVTTITRGTEWYKADNDYNTDRSSSTYSYGFPTQVKTWSSLGGGTRTALITYLKDADDWILGLTDTVTKNGKLFDDYGYDTKGRATSHKRFGVTIGTYGYYTSGTQAGLVNWYKDALNRQTTFSSWKRGIPGTVTRADSTTLGRGIDDNGWVISITNWRGYTTGYTYNDVGWLTAIDRPSPWTDTTIAYSGLGSGLVQTATRGTERDTTTYDAMVRPIRVRRQALSGGGGNIYTETDYDAMGRTVFTSLPSTSTGSSIGIETDFDALDRVTETRETATGGGTIGYAYLAGNKTQVTDPVGNITTTTSSGYGSPDDGNVVKVERPEGITVDSAYNIYGNPTSIAQAKGGGATHDSSFYYDSRLRLCRRSIPETGDTLYKYNNANELTQYAEGQPSDTGCATPPTATRVVLSYDVLSRLKTTNYPSGTPDITRTYDANSNLLTINRGGANWTYVYNSVDLPSSETLTIDSRTYSIGNTYDNNERLTQKAFPSGNTYDFDPDGFGRPKRIRYGGVNYTSGISYHPNGKVQSLTRGNGGVFDQQLNGRQLTSFIGSTYGDDLNFTYDANGRVTQINAVANNAWDRSFTYDGAGRLKTALGPWGSGTYLYDPLSNITKKTLGSRVVDIQYTSANQVYRVRDTGVSSSWRSYSHDARGNVTADGIHTFTNDYANQPTAIGGADSGTYQYDGNLKRVKQIVGGETIYSVYDSSGALLTRDNASAGEKTDYLSVAGQTFVRLTNGVATYPLSDHLGTAFQVANQIGSVVAEYIYTPFGEAYGSQSPGSTNEQGFTGHVEDATGLTYMQARYYDPVIGRFLQADPIVYTEQLNFYAYVKNDPTYLSDRTGKCITGTCHFGEFSHPTSIAQAKQNGQVAGNALIGSIAVSAVIAAPEIVSAALANPATASEIAITVGEIAIGDAAPAGITGAAVYGAAQVTKKAGEITSHASTSARIASEMSQSGEYASVHLNQAAKTITEGAVDSAVRPDVAGVLPNGKVDVMEVLSPGQTAEGQIGKNREAFGEHLNSASCVNQDSC